MRLAELWLEDATTLPSGTSQVAVWSPAQWVDTTMPTWQRLCDPVAQRVAGAWVEGLPEEARQMAGPMLGMISQVGGMAFGSQLGAGLAQLAKEVLTSSEVGLPLGPEGTAALLPAAITTFTEGIDRPAGEVLVFLAAREAAHQRLFGHVPWLRQRLLATVEEFAHGITIDTSRMEELARDVDPMNPESLQQLMSSGMFEPQTTESQKVALRRLETLLALVEGWVDVVVADAVGERLPGASALGRDAASPPRLRRPRGADLRHPRRARAAAAPAARRRRAVAVAHRRARHRGPRRGLVAPRPHADRRRPRRPGRLRGRHEDRGERRRRPAGSAESFTDLDDPLARLEAEMKAEQEAKDAKDAEKDGREGDGPSS